MRTIKTKQGTAMCKTSGTRTIGDKKTLELVFSSILKNDDAVRIRDFEVLTVLRQVFVRVFVGTINIDERLHFGSEGLLIRDHYAELGLYIFDDINGTIIRLCSEFRAYHFCEIGLGNIVVAAMIHSKAAVLQCTGFDTKEGSILDGGSINTPWAFRCLTNDFIALTRRAYRFEFEGLRDSICCTCIFEVLERFEFGPDGKWMGCGIHERIRRR